MLASWIFWLAVACCTVAQAAIVRSSLMSRAAGAGATLGHRASELAWTVLPPIGLLLVLFLTWRAIRDHGGMEHPDPAARSAQHAADPQPVLFT